MYPDENCKVAPLCKKFCKEGEGFGEREENLFQKVSSLPPEYLNRLLLNAVWFQAPAVSPGEITSGKREDRA
jgi:hypothetical protein